MRAGSQRRAARYKSGALTALSGDRGAFVSRRPSASDKSALICGERGGEGGARPRTGPGHTGPHISMSSRSRADQPPPDRQPPPQHRSGAVDGSAAVRVIRVTFVAIFLSSV